MIEAILKGLLAAVVFIVMMMLLFAVFAFPIYWLWNWLMPTLFHLPVIDVWQAWGLGALTGLLFKSSAGERIENHHRRAEALVAVWDGVSPGTLHMINVAYSMNLQVYVMKLVGDVEAC